jgi:hypothetical protein
MCGERQIRWMMSGAEVDVGAVRKGLRADILAHLCGVAAGMDADLAEIRAEPRLHVVAHVVRQGIPVSFAQFDLLFDIDACLKAATGCREGQGRIAFLFVLPQAPLHDRRDRGCEPLARMRFVRRACQWRRSDRGIWSGQYPARDVIGFPLVKVATGADGQLSLRTENRALWSEAFCLYELRYAPIAYCSLQLKNRMNVALAR